MEINDVTALIVDSGMRIHSALGPGLLEGVYQACLVHELRGRGLHVDTNVEVPVTYGDLSIETGLRLDLLVNDLVIVELKAVERIHPIHHAQLMTYLKLSKRKVGLLMNFNVIHLKDGITRFVNGL